MVSEAVQITFQGGGNQGSQIGVNNGTVYNTYQAPTKPSLKSRVAYRHSNLKDKRATETCDWLLERNEFKDWEESRSQLSALCIHGRVGCGKSMLVSRAVDHIKDNRDSDLLYFYIDITDHELRDLTQLRLAFWEQAGVKPTLDTPDPDQIWEDLGEFLKRSHKRVYIVIDSLDRLSTDERDQLIDKLDALSKEAVCGLSILLSSTDDEPLGVLAATRRPNGADTADKFQKFGISVGKDENADDIRKYAKSKLRTAKFLLEEESPRLEGTINEFAARLTEGAGGIFLWAVLRVAEICDNETRAGAYSSLERPTPPKGIVDEYRRIVERLKTRSPTNQMIGKRAIALLTHSTTMIPARAFIIALTVRRAGLGGMDKVEELKHNPESLRSELEEKPEVVIKACGHLVELDRQLDVFRFHHASVYDHFAEEPPEWKYPLVAEISLSYLCSLGPEAAPCAEASWYNPELLEHHLLKYPFLEFASCYWPYATRMCPYDENRDMLVEFCKKDNIMQLAFQIFLQLQRRSMALDICSAHVLGYFGLIDCFTDSEMEYLLDPSRCDSNGWTAMHWAVEKHTNGSWHIVERLISHGADVNARDKNQCTPLYYACLNGKLDVVNLLLKKGATINARDERGRTPLITACLGDYDLIVKKLIEYNVDIGIRSDIGTALHAAALAGAEKCVDIILRRRRLSKRGNYFGTPLHAAAFHGHPGIVEKLLRYGFKPNKMSKGFGTPLAAAAAGCCEGQDVASYLKICDVLLKYGAKVNTRGGPYETALHAAASYGHTDLVERLLDRGAAVNVQGHLGTPYQVAKNAGYEKVMDLLADRGADTSACDEYRVHAGLSRVWILTFRVALATNNDNHIKFLINSFKSVVERCIQDKQNHIVQWMSSVGAEAFTIAVAAVVAGDHGPGTEPALGDVTARIPAPNPFLGLLCPSLLSIVPRIHPGQRLIRYDPDQPPQPNRRDPRHPLLDQLARAGWFIAGCAVASKNGEAASMIANTWVTTLRKIMAKHKQGTQLIEIVAESPTVELVEMLTRPEEEGFNRAAEIDKFGGVVAEMLVAACSQGSAGKPLFRCFARMWGVALERVERLDGDHLADIGRLIGTFVDEYRGGLDKGDRGRVKWFLESGFEVARMVTAGGSKNLSDTMARITVEMWQQAFKSQMGSLVDGIVDRIGDELGECERSYDDQEIVALTTLALRILQVSLEKNFYKIFDIVASKLSSVMAAALKEVKRHVHLLQRERHHRCLFDSATRTIQIARDSGRLVSLSRLAEEVSDLAKATPNGITSPCLTTSSFSTPKNSMEVA